jgi:mRNA interferase MazF
MKRGELYRVRRSPGDAKPARAFVIVSRQPLIDSAYSTVICAPVFTQRQGLPTQVAVGPRGGRNHESGVHCDVLMSLEKTRLTDFVDELGADKLRELDAALAVALGLQTRSRSSI